MAFINSADSLRLLRKGAVIHGLLNFKFDNESIRPSHIDRVVEAIYEDLEGVVNDLTSLVGDAYLLRAGGTMTGDIAMSAAAKLDYANGVYIQDSLGNILTSNPVNEPNIFGLSTASGQSMYLVDGFKAYLACDNDNKFEADTAGLRLYSSNSFIFFNSTTSFKVELDLSSVTAPRDISFPDKSGTMALTSDLYTYLPLAGGTMGGDINIALWRLKNIGYASFQNGFVSKLNASFLTVDREVSLPDASGTVSLDIGGVTGSRPSTPHNYQTYFDTTLGKPIWYDGTNWVDATGTTV
tara:strand:+ start:204 stop:1091 length:888 start_codon:yes stop_codon:yes gene_type:complete